MADPDESAEAVWREQAMPLLTLRPRRRLRLVPVLIPVALLAVLAAASHALWWRQPSHPSPSGDKGQKTAGPLALPAAPLAYPSRFPANGFTVINLPRGTPRAASLSLATEPLDATLHWVVNLRDWASGAWVETIYLDANSVTTLRVPAGAYQVSAAGGDAWEGDALLFGDATKAFRFRAAVRLGAGSPASRMLLLPPDAQAAMPVPAFMVRTR